MYVPTPPSWPEVFKFFISGPNWCGSVGWASSYKQKGQRSDSWLGHTSRSRVRSQVRMCAEGDQSMFLTANTAVLWEVVPADPT